MEKIARLHEGCKYFKMCQSLQSSKARTLAAGNIVNAIWHLSQEMDKPEVQHEILCRFLETAQALIEQGKYLAFSNLALGLVHGAERYTSYNRNDETNMCEGEPATIWSKEIKQKRVTPRIG